MAPRTITTKLELSGEAEYRAKLKNINAELALQKSELERIQAQYRSSANSMEALSAKQSALEGRISALNEKHREQAAMLEQARQAQQKYATQAEELRERLNGLAGSAEDTSEEQKKLQEEIDAAEVAMQKAANSVTYYQRELNKTERDQAKWEDELGRTRQYLDEAKSSTNECARSIDQYGKEVKQAGDSSEQFGSVSAEAVNQLASALAAAGVAKTVKEIADALMASVDAFAAFQSQMSAVQAISGASGEEMDALAEKAKYMGSTTAFTATEAGQALEYMAMAGWKTGDMLGGLEGIMNLAAASGESLGATSDIVTDALTAFGLAAQDSARFADVLAAASSNSNTNVAMMGETFKYAAPVAGALGYSIEDTALAIGLMANAGIKGSQAGTALRGTLTNLAKPSDDVLWYMDELGVSLTDSAGRTRSLSELMDVLRARFADLTEAQKAEYAAGIAGKEAMSGLLAIVNAGEQDYQRLRDAIAASSGAAKEMSEIRLDNFSGQMTLLSSAADGLKLAIGEQLTPVLTHLAEAGTDAFTWATEFVSENEWVVSVIVGLTAALGALVAGFAGFSILSTITPLIKDFTLALAANPIGAVAIAVVGVVAALGTLAATMENTSGETKKFTKSLQESKQAYEELQDAMDERQGSTKATADALKDLLMVEEKSAAQKAVILDLVAQLNEAVPGLNLAYDSEKDALVGLTASEVAAALERAAAQEEQEARVKRLSELYAERAELEARLTQAQGELSAAYESGVTSAEAYERSSGAAGAAVRNAEGAVRTLTSAFDENAAEIAELEDATNAYAQQQDEHTLTVETMTARVDELTAQMQSLEEQYHKDYNAAMESIEGQLGLFKKMDGSAKTSINSLIETLKGQVAYMDDYAANIQKAMELGVDEGLVKKLSDGSEESAQILAAIVQGGEEDIAALNAELANVDEGKRKFSETVADMERDFDEKMDALTADLNDAKKEMECSDELYAIGANDVRGIIEGAKSQYLPLQNQYRELGRAAVAAYKMAVDQRSPSHKFEEAGRFDIQGIIKGADAETPELKAAYAAAAEAAMNGFQEAAEEKTAEVGKAMMSGLTEWLNVVEHGLFLNEKNGSRKDVVTAYREMQDKIHKTAGEFRALGYAETSDEIRKLQKMWWGYQDEITSAEKAALKEREDAAREYLSNVQDLFSQVSGLLTAKSDVTDLEYQLWERTEGKDATEAEKYTKQLQNLSAQQKNQEAIVAAAEKAYQDVTAQYGEASEESYRYQKALLQEKLALQDLLDEIQKVNDARAQAESAARQERAKAFREWAKGDKAAPFEWPGDAASSSWSAGSGYQASAKTALDAMARNQITVSQGAPAQRDIVRQVEAISAATVNAISSVAQGQGPVREVVRLVTVDGKVLASATFDDYVDYGDSNGTPIVNRR